MAVPAGVVGDARKVAVVAFFDMAAQRGGAANFNSAHDAQLLKGKLVSFPVSAAVLSENVGHFKSRPWHPGLFPGLRFRLAPDPVERTGGGGDDVRGHLGVPRRGFDAAVPQQRLNDAGIGAIFQKVRCERVSQRVSRNAFRQAAAPGRIAACLR
jgi:hypothetical protein